MLNGIVNIYKEAGYTSHDVVAKLRGILGQRKIGHTGTLDPDAVGVLPVCLGRATKVCDFLTEKEKEYEAVLLLGQVTDTQDVSGQVLEKREVSGVTEEQIRQVIQNFTGSYAQIPPMYSAVKIGGKKLYELAREGKTVERRPRMVQIFSIVIQSVDIPRVRMTVRCSKGTYIRTLCHDIGEKLECGGCMESLIRTRSGVFTLENSVTLDEVIQKRDQGHLTDIILPVDRVFDRYPKITVKAQWESLARNGGILQEKAVCCKEPNLSDKTLVRLYDEDGQFIALYAWQETDRTYRIEKMFFHDKTEEK